ncbi:hypothetical protein RclHR1_03130003 [Rhizophagus clarus]|uniref:Kinase-like domain-containing protein n=1 Tax=Rhizophagus clarus TaxID=94130 RepID=A0A2Z6RAL3_9GLOM|nr:hypothetical protein RclHR1_03130003 [Rhizophagus clarus]GES81819.1 kinase-like domain-containing protein [Rhizophagus clarus]
MKHANNTSDENSFNPTPKLKSSPIPIKFIAFNEDIDKCIYCGEKYIETLFCKQQKYCKKCLSRHINDISDINEYMDVHYRYMMNSKHQINNIQILYFKQINGHNSAGIDNFNQVIESEKCCKLCGKSLSYTYREYDNLKLCSDCYLISTEWVESTLTRQIISILYLPWWHNDPFCKNCNLKLSLFTSSDCQDYCIKNCGKCNIFYIGCRYCLTTNIIFGLTGKSQCKKCNRILFILGNNFNETIYNNSSKLTNLKINDKYFYPSNILDYIYLKEIIMTPLKWIPYFEFENVKEIREGGYGIIYKATWMDNNETIIMKRFTNSKYINKDFLNELKSNQICSKYNAHLIKTYGFTKDPKLEDYIIIMKYASGGDLHDCLKQYFTEFTWSKQKLIILWQISKGLENIHNNGFIHRDLHSGNILFDLCVSKTERFQWKIGDLGLSQPVNDTSSNADIYGVIPYIAPEIFKGSSFSKESDIYCMGMIMWELTTGCKPFSNVEHDINLILRILDGERPKITEDTPECYANLMKSCWDPDPKQRPSAKMIRNTFGSWFFRCKNDEIFDQAEKTRMELLRSKKIGPEFAEKRHSEAIYTSRLLSAFISKCSSTYSSSTTSFDSNYIPEIENNTDTKSLSSQNLNSTIRNFSPSLDCNYVSTEVDFDIDIESSSSQNLISIIQTSSSALKNEILKS